MTPIVTDVFLSGGGIAGLTAALAFAEAGFSVHLASPAPPVRAPQDDGSDLRSTAFLQPAQALFERIGLWDDLAPDAVPLRALRIVDSTGTPPAARDDRRFTSQDLGLDSFGWNLINWRTAAVLLDRLERHPQVTLLWGTRFVASLVRDREALVRLSDGTRLKPRLVIGADGRNSAVRHAAGIDTDVHRTGQVALAFTVSHPVPHEDTSTEIYHEGGPLTMVPLPLGADGQPASAVVWMNPATEARRLAELDPDALSAAATERSCHWLGPLDLSSAVRQWPIISLRARALTSARTALIAEAAHVMPPIGAQGLNTSLHDVTALVDLAREAPDRLGDAAMMDAYSSARRTDIAARVAAIDLFNRVTRSGSPTIQALRLAGLRTVHDLTPLRRAVMRAGMGQ